MQLNAIEGLWPVMLTPFTDEGEIDFPSLERLIAWYEDKGATGLFAVCQSSETFFLNLRERVALVRFIKEHAHVPVIASGHVACGLQAQAEELKQIGDAGADALILITNRLVFPGKPQQSMIPALEYLLGELDPALPLGFYECPYPFKRLITDEELKWAAESGRFRFMKDTCCDRELIRRRVEILQGSPLKLFNANSTTYLDSLRDGAAGFSGVMMNFHMDLYRWLFDNWQKEPEKAEDLQSFLTLFSEIERQYYPVNAKYHLMAIEHVFSSIHTRTLPAEGLTETFREEVRHMDRAAARVREMLSLR